MSNLSLDTKVNMLMMPRQKPIGGGFNEGGGKRSFEQGSKPSGQDKGKGGGKAARKGQGKDKMKKHRGGGNPSLPDGLRTAKGKMVTSYNDKPICLAYNLQGCSLEVDATGHCPKGLHVCTRKGCGGNHS